MPNVVGGYAGVSQQNASIFGSGDDSSQPFASRTRQYGVADILQNKRNTILNPPFGVNGAGESTTNSVPPADNSLEMNSPLGLRIENSNWFAWLSIAAVALYFLDRFDIL